MASSWTERHIRDFALRKKIINTPGDDIPPLSVTKDQGVILQSERYKKRIATDPRKYVIVEDGDFAFDPMSLYYGAIGRVKRKGRGLISPDYVSFAVDATVDATFIEYFLRSKAMVQKYESVAELGNKFGKRRRVYWSVFHDLTVVLPPLGEQKQIAAILASADSTIETSLSVIAHLRQVKRALMQELLTKGMPGRHSRFQQTEAGEIPESWELRRLDELAEVRTGVAKNSRKPKSAPQQIPYLRVANVQDGRLDLTEIKNIEIDVSLIERYALRSGDVLFTEGGDADKLGRGTVWRSEIPLCLHQNHVFAVRPSGRLLPEFLSFQGASERGKAYFLDCAKQTTNLASINSTQLRGFPVPLPGIEEQREIVSAIASVVSLEERERSHLERLGGLKASLLKTLLSGEVRVPLEQEAA